jgi:hypothetical protein
MAVAVTVVTMIMVVIVIMCILLWRLRSTATLAIAGIVTVKQTCVCCSAKAVCIAGLPVQGLTRRGSIYTSKVGVIVRRCRVVVFRVEAELGLNGGRVNAILVKAVADGTGEFHVSCRSLALEVEVDLNVQTCNQLGVAQLPDVEVVGTNNTRKLLNILLDVIDAQTSRDSLEQDARGGETERNGRSENDAGDDEGNTRIGVEAPFVIGEPDEQGRSNDTDVSKSVAHNVKEDTTHVEIVVRMTVATSAGLFLGLSVVVFLVVYGLWLLNATIAVGSILIEERLLSGLIDGIVLSGRFLGVFARFDVLESASLDDGTTERWRVDRDVFDRVSSGTRTAGLWLSTAVARVGDFDIIASSGAAGGRLLSLGPVCDSALGQHIGNISRLVSNLCIFVMGSMALFGVADGVSVAMAVRVTAVTVAAMAVVVEEEETDDVGGETETSYNQHKLRVADFLRLDETLNRFKEDGETQSDEEDAVDQGS